MRPLPYMDAKLIRPGPMNKDTPLHKGIPMIIRPDDFATVDGDTISSLTSPNEEGKRSMGFSVRFRTINAAEKVRNTKIEQAYTAMGAPSGITRGDLAKDFLKRKMKDHAVMIIPAINPDTGDALRDKRGRIIGDVFISGTPGDSFDIANAVSVADMMIENGYATSNPREKRAESSAYNALRRHEGRMPSIVSGPTFSDDSNGLNFT